MSPDNVQSTFSHYTPVAAVLYSAYSTVPLFFLGFWRRQSIKLLRLQNWLVSWPSYLHALMLELGLVKLSFANRNSWAAQDVWTFGGRISQTPSLLMVTHTIIPWIHSYTLYPAATLNSRFCWIWTSWTYNLLATQLHRVVTVVMMTVQCICIDDIYQAHDRKQWWATVDTRVAVWIPQNSRISWLDVGIPASAGRLWFKPRTF
jgi:hypothetical protein